MNVIASRTRVAGCAPLYSYRALVPLDSVDPDRRHRVAILHVQIAMTRSAYTRIADTIAPHRWFERDIAVSFGLAAQLGLAARRIEALLLQSVFPEMTTWLAPIALRLEHDRGSASHRVATIDLNAAFDAVIPRIDTLTAAELAPPDPRNDAHDTLHTFPSRSGRLPMGSGPRLARPSGRRAR